MPDATRRALEAHARAEAPNEACGVLAIRDGVAECYYRCINLAASPYRFELSFPDPNVPFELEDRGYTIGVFHSHVSSPPRPSRTDVENIGLWEGRPYVILSVRTGELAAFEIDGGRISELPLDAAR